MSKEIIEFKAEWKAGAEFMGKCWLENPSKDIHVEEDEFGAVTVKIGNINWRTMPLLIDRGCGVTVAETLGQVVDNAIERMLEAQGNKVENADNNVIRMLNKIYLVIRHGSDERLKQMAHFLFHDIPFVVEEETVAVYGNTGDKPYAQFKSVKLYKEGELGPEPVSDPDADGRESAGLTSEEAGDIYAGLSKKMAESMSVDYGSDESKDLDPFLQITYEMYKTYLKKNADYGNSFDRSLDEFGLVASVVRMQDKLNRLKKLSRNFEEAPEVADESVGDTLLDLANYAILTAKWLKND